MEKEILKLQELEKELRESYSFYRNYPTQENLRYIYRKRPRYLLRKKILNKIRDIIKAGKLPESYLVDELVLMPKNNESIYAYWEIKEETFEKMKENIKGENPVIILKNQKGKTIKEINTSIRNGSMYINNLKSNEEYYGQIGYYDKNNNYIVISSSNNVLVANDKISENEDISWGLSKRILKDGKEVIEFSYITEEDKERLIGFRQELLDKELIKEVERSEFLGSSENTLNNSMNSSFGIRK